MHRLPGGGYRVQASAATQYRAHAVEIVPALQERVGDREIGITSADLSQSSEDHGSTLVLLTSA